MQHKKEYFNELLYIQNNLYKIRKNPYHKAQNITWQIEIYLYYLLEFLIIIGILFRLYHNVYLIYPLGILLTLFIFFLIYYGKVRDLIKVYLKELGEYSYEINKEKINLTVNDQYQISVLWQDLNYIIFNKTTISFITKKISGIIIILDIKEKNKILKELQKYGQDNLVVDNY